jgi:hypothetical protein
LEAMGELASQLTQEFGDRDSQILRLEAENARLRAFEVEKVELEAKNARLRTLEGENARLRALLEAAAPSNKPSFTTTNATPDVELQSRRVTAEDRQQSEDALVDEACDVTEVDGSRSPRFPEVASGRFSNTRRTGNSIHYQNSSSDDDEDPIPLPKKEKASLTAAAAKNALSRTSHLGATATTGANKRKRAAGSSFSSRLSESLQGLGVDESTVRSQRPPTFVHPTSQSSQTRPAKRSRPSLAASSRQKQVPTTNKQTPAKKHTHVPHAYTPLQKSPFQKLSNATAPPPPRKNQQPSNFDYTDSSDSSDDDSGTANNNTTRPNQPKWPKQKTQPKPTTTAAKRTSTYAEMTPFTFNFVHSYTASTDSEDGPPDMLVFDSATLKNNMSSFWKTLTSLRNKWEDQAGADWAWEVQKKVKTRGRARGNGAYKRFCVSSRLADRPTKWRHGDSGLFACLECAGAAKPCFTWVRDEDGGEEEGDDGVFGAPKGEFLCLPVHQDDRRCVEVEGREIRTWINEEGSSSDEDDSGEESDESAFDAYDDDDSELTSEASSEESSEEDYGGADSDGEL